MSNEDEKNGFKFKRIRISGTVEYTVKDVLITIRILLNKLQQEPDIAFSPERINLPSLLEALKELYLALKEDGDEIYPD